MKCEKPQFIGMILALIIAFTAFVLSAKSDAPRDNNPVCTADSAQSNPVAISHSSGGGAIIAWQDQRNGNSDIFAQRLFGNDSMEWGFNGVPLCTESSDQQHPVIISDSSEGAIIAWEDSRNGYHNIFVQKVNAWGAAQWANNGVALCVALFDQRNAAITLDSTGGAIVTWEDNRQGADLPDIYAQRISKDGVTQWGLNGVAVCVSTADQLDPQILCNIRGGAIISWQDKRSGDYDIYAQRIDSTGTPLWVANGVAISSAASDQLKPQMIGDGNSGAIIVWNDFRSTIDYNIFAQRIGAEGAVTWTVDGHVMNNNMSGDQLNPVIATDGSAGAIIAWEDKRGNDVDIYGQRVNSVGGVQWAAEGVSICTATGDQLVPQIVRLYSGGANIAWVDHRNAASAIYIQMLTADGAIQLGPSGMAVCTADSNQINPVCVSNNCTDETIVTWQDFRNNNSDIYTRIIPRELLGIRRGPLPSAAIPPRNGILCIAHSVRIHYQLEDAGRVSLEILDLSGRLQATLVNGYQFPGSYSVAINDNHAHGRIPCGVYLCHFSKDSYESVHKVSIMR